MLRTNPPLPPGNDKEALLDEAARRLAEILIAQWEYHRRQEQGWPVEEDDW